MAFPPPPGLNSSQSPVPSSLPPRPPPSKSSFSRGGGHGGSNSAAAPFTGFAPRAVAAHNRGATLSAGPTGPSSNNNAGAYGGGVPAGPGIGPINPYQQSQPSGPPSYYPQQQQQQQQSNGYSNNYDASSSYSVPQIRNPFAPPTAGDGGRGVPAYDPEMEAQIAQWQSAYAAKDDRKPTFGGGMGNANLTPLGGGSRVDALSAAEASAAGAESGVAAVVTGADGKRKTVVRSGGGQTWQDPSLLEWDPSHFRIFVGNLAGEVTDDSLLKAFARFPSVQKARVVRDKRSTKSKGYGFVSFADGDDYFQAAREMQGKYIGSHPVLIKKSTTDIKAVTPKDRNKKGGKGGGKGEDGAGAGYGANTGAGVHKKQSKTKSGMKILG